MSSLKLRLSNLKLLVCFLLAWTCAKIHFAKKKLRKADNRFLIVPCDPWSVDGSRGDQAMISSILAHIHSKCEEPVVSVVCESENHFTIFTI